MTRSGIAHFGTFDVENFGDLLFPLVARHRLGLAAGELTAVSPAGGAPVWAGSCSTIATRDALAHEGFAGVLLGGGNIVHAREAGVARYADGGELPRLTAYPGLWIGAALLAARSEIPLVWNGPGVPRSFDPQAARLVRLVAAGSDLLTVRDSASRRHLEAAGVDAPIDIVPDTAFDVVRLWTDDELAEGRFAAFTSRGVDVPERHAVFHVNSRYAADPPDALAQRIERMASGLGATPVLVALGPCHDDHEFARSVGRAIAGALVVRPTDLVEIVALLRHAVLYAGSSLHGFIVSSAFGRPAVLVADEEVTGLRKFSGLLEQFQAPHLLFASWPDLEGDFDTVRGLPEATWKPFGAPVRSRLDAHWSRVSAALAAAPAVDKSGLIADAVNGTSWLERAGLLGPLLSDALFAERRRGSATKAELERSAAVAASEHSAALAAAEENVQAATAREAAAVQRATSLQAEADSALADATAREAAATERAAKLEVQLAGARSRAREAARAKTKAEVLEAQRAELAESLAAVSARAEILAATAAECETLRAQVAELEVGRHEALAGYVAHVEADSHTILELTEQQAAAKLEAEHEAAEALRAREAADAQAARNAELEHDVEHEAADARRAREAAEAQAARNSELEHDVEHEAAAALRAREAADAQAARNEELARDVERLQTDLEAERHATGELTDMSRRLADSAGRLSSVEVVLNAVREELAASMTDASAASSRADAAATLAAKRQEMTNRIRAERDVARRERDAVRLGLRERDRLFEDARHALADERELVRQFHVEIERSASDIERVARSWAWRIGHGLTLATSRILMRPPNSASGAVETTADRLHAMQERLDRRKPLVIGGAQRRRAGDRKLRVAVVAWDMGHNPAGRAFLLADLLSRKHDVELVGAQFPRYGTAIWEPIRDSSLSMRTFPGMEFPEHLESMERFVATLEADVIYACKPRLPALAVAMLAREAAGTPVIVDVDDHELSFFGDVEAVGLDQVRTAEDTDLALPFGALWTRYSDGLVAGANAVTTSNHTLQAVYGGELIPHARDELRFDPSRYDRKAIRARHGFEPDDRVVLFSGTPRRHKGVIQIADALEALGNPRYKLCVVGTVRDPEVSERLARMDPNSVRLIADQPFDRLPENMMLGDLVCILQDPASAIAHYQMPAKLTDAFAMEIPVITTKVAPLEPLGERGLVTLLAKDASLAEQIEATFAGFDAAKDRARKARQFFLNEWSYKAVEPRLDRTIERLTGRSHTLPTSWRCTLELLRDRYTPQRDADPELTVGSAENGVAAPVAPRAPATRRGRRRPLADDDRWDVVFFWKQNDSGLYGRRSDMLAQHLSRSPRVGRVVHFDAPIDFAAYRKHLRTGKSEQFHQSTDIYELTRRRAKGRAHRGDLRNHTFLHQSEQPMSLAERRLPKACEHLEWLARTLRNEGIGSRRTVLWTCPVHFGFTEIADSVAHDLVVADVIDDHRAWLTEGTGYYRRVEDNYRNILGRADVVLANCEPVRRRMLAFDVDAHVIPNAMEIWDGSSYSQSPAELRKLKGPIIGYVGNLSSRIDMALLEHLIPARPGWNFVFIGSAHLSREILDLDRHANVHFLGVKRYPEVVAYIRAFDAGIIPHQDNEMTQAMSPLKAFVYAGCGVPTVTTEIGNLTSLRSCVRTARTHDGFVAELDDIVASSLKGTDLRPPRDFLEQHTWAARIKVIERLVDAALDAKSTSAQIPVAAAATVAATLPAALE